MKAKTKEKMENLKASAMKKTTDGIIDVLLRMYAADTSGCMLLEFLYKVKEDSPSEFYNRPIQKKGEDKIE